MDTYYLDNLKLYIDSMAAKKCTKILIKAKQTNYIYL